LYLAQSYQEPPNESSRYSETFGVQSKQRENPTAFGVASVAFDVDVDHHETTAYPFREAGMCGAMSLH